MQTRRLASSWNALPCEIWDCVLNDVSASKRQQTALALSRALPAIRLSRHHLFVHSRINSNEQALLLYRQLSPRQHDAQELFQIVRTFIVECWTPTPDLVTNLIAKMHNLLEIRLNIGPFWSPEPLENMLRDPYLRLKRLRLRFNPYLKKKSYFAFCKGAYYDNTLDNLARWPALPTFRTFAFEQDLPPDGISKYDNSSDIRPPLAFAQPLVLFKTFCIGNFIVSNAARHLKEVRLRIPQRSLLATLAALSTRSTIQPLDGICQPLPSLELLDISSTYVSPGPALRNLFCRYPSLKYLILDRTGLMGHVVLREIAYIASSAGIQRAKQARRAWRALLMHKSELEAVQSVSGRPVAAGDIGDPGIANTAHSAYYDASQPNGQVLRRYRSLPLMCYILPSASALLSLCCGSGNELADADQKNPTAFCEGWQQGCTSLRQFALEQLDSFRQPLVHGTLNARSVLCRFADPNETLPFDDNAAMDDVWEHLKQVWRLVEVDDYTITGIFTTGTECVVCTVPDCSGEGISAVDKPEAFVSTTQWRPAPPTLHTPACGHLQARQAFDHDIM